MKIHVFSSHCFYSSMSANKNRPEKFSKELCYKNLKRTGGDDVSITYMLDVTLRPSNAVHFLETAKEQNIVNIEGGNGAQSFLSTIQYVEKLPLKDDDIIYFCEDDYFHIDGWPFIMMEGFTLGTEFVSLYDHVDKYGMIPAYNTLTSQILITEHTHWRTVPNTTNTYACLFKTFIKYIDIHKKYCDLVEKWTKDSHKFAELMHKGSSLITPLPGWSTHMEEGYMGPITDWQYYIQKELEEK